jgi:hypothetical protein
MDDGFKRFRDYINTPDHYQKGDYEPIKIIEVYGLDFFEGNILKYLLRYKKKNGLEDLQKAQWYLNALVDKEKKKANKGCLFDDKIDYNSNLNTHKQKSYDTDLG